MSEEKEEGFLEILKKELSEAREQERECRETLRKKVAELEEENIFFRRQAIVDGLTKVYNRRYFEEEFEKEFLTAKRLKNILSVIMIDVDFFKGFNDFYGHLEGDKVLQKIALELSLILKRPADFVARYGGEEFVFVLPDTDQAGAEHLAEETRAQIERLKIPHKVNIASPSGFLTISLGVATLKLGEISSKQLLERADQNLFKAKECGRNRVYSQPSDES